MNTDAAGATPEPGTTPEPDDKGDALAALLAAGEQNMSEPEPDNENGRGKSKGKSQRSRPGSEEQRGEEDEQVGVGKPVLVCDGLSGLMCALSTACAYIGVHG